MMSGQIMYGRRGGESRAEKLSQMLDDQDQKSIKRVMQKCGIVFREKLFLASYDIMSVNLSSTKIYQVY